MQVSNIFHEWERADSIHLALESAFDVEEVTREFFKEYKRVFDAALDKISGFGTDESEQEAKKLFTQTLFNRLMFVYFISRKGWLSFNGDKDYLRALWRDYAGRAGSVDGEPNFRYDRLRPLFFGGSEQRRAPRISLPIPTRGDSSGRSLSSTAACLRRPTWTGVQTSMSRTT